MKWRSTMSEYESSMHLNKSDRTWNYVGLVIATTTLIASVILFGHGRWITWIAECIFVFVLAAALWQLITFRNSVRVARRYDGYIPLGNKNLFYSSDRDPDDRRLI